ncbi:uncharacterized protein LOC111622249 [Centruroides sculpturatus]|uniref:uncharacterized protein LOC111622249 n=1 Tax=Centruroides sculpturatus TaxID=218467 RepID=UPI000C6CF2AE|nr:uncharacterized protein LOC111622249 [Centruroides sculpturatus]
MTGKLNLQASMSMITEIIVVLYAILFMDLPVYILVVNSIMFVSLFFALVFYISVFLPLSINMSKMWNLLMSLYFNTFDINSELKILNLLQMQKHSNDGLTCNKFIILNTIFIVKFINYVVIQTLVLLQISYIY